MPTENRSSNTEQMVSVPREVAEQIATDTEHDNDLLWIAKEMRKILSQPAAQHQGEPVAYLDLVSGNTFKDAEAIETAGRRAIPLYDYPPTCDGFSAEQMTVQGADGYRNGINAAAELAADYPELAQAIRELPLPQ